MSLHRVSGNLSDLVAAATIINGAAPPKEKTPSSPSTSGADYAADFTEQRKRRRIETTPENLLQPAQERDTRVQRISKAALPPRYPRKDATSTVTPNPLLHSVSQGLILSSMQEYGLGNQVLQTHKRPPSAPLYPQPQPNFHQPVTMSVPSQFQGQAFLVANQIQHHTPPIPQTLVPTSHHLRQSPSPEPSPRFLIFPSHPASIDLTSRAQPPVLPPMQTLTTSAIDLSSITLPPILNAQTSNLTRQANITNLQEMLKAGAAPGQMPAGTQIRLTNLQTPSGQALDHEGTITTQMSQFSLPLIVSLVDKNKKDLATKMLAIPFEQLLQPDRIWENVPEAVISLIRAVNDLDTYPLDPSIKADLQYRLDLRAVFLLLGIQNNVIDFRQKPSPENLKKALEFMKLAHKHLQFVALQIPSCFVEVHQYDQAGEYLGTSRTSILNFHLLTQKSVLHLLEAYCLLEINAPALSAVDRCGIHKALFQLQKVSKCLEKLSSVNSPEAQDHAAHLYSNLAFVQYEIGKRMHHGPCYSLSSVPGFSVQLS